MGCLIEYGYLRSQEACNSLDLLDIIRLSGAQALSFKGSNKAAQHTLIVLTYVLVVSE
jgi:hypothetical protein